MFPRAIPDVNPSSVLGNRALYEQYAVQCRHLCPYSLVLQSLKVALAVCHLLDKSDLRNSLLWMATFSNYV